MKKVTSIAFALILSGLTVFATQQVKPVSDSRKTQKTKMATQYTCLMHHDVISNKPGKCPKCGMTLVKKEPAKKNTDKTKM